MVRSQHRKAGWLALLMGAWLAVAAVASLGLARGGGESVELRPIAVWVPAKQAASQAAEDETPAERTALLSGEGLGGSAAAGSHRSCASASRVSPLTASRHHIERLFYRHCAILR